MCFKTSKYTNQKRFILALKFGISFSKVGTIMARRENYISSKITIVAVSHFLVMTVVAV